MKAVLDLVTAISDSDNFERQFNLDGKEKNILFVNPQLSSRHLYKMIIPFFALRSEKVATAITAISKYDPEGQLLGGKEVELNDKMIEWSDFIVFPFTTQPLVSEIYEKIRSVNPDTKIIYQVDFNYYELSQKNPYKIIFEEPSVLNSVEDNIYFSDMVLVSNKVLQDYLLKKIQEVIKEKYDDVIPNVQIGCMPIMMDTELFLGNVDYDAEQLIFVDSDINPPADMIKKAEETGGIITESELTPQPPSKHTDIVSDLIEETSKKASEVKKSNRKTKKIKDVRKSNIGKKPTRKTASKRS
jgi:hypothetical protein